MNICDQGFCFCLCLLTGIVYALPSEATTDPTQNQTLTKIFPSITIGEQYKVELAREANSPLLLMTLAKQKEQQGDYCAAAVTYLAAATEPLKRGSLEEAQPFLEATSSVASKIPPEHRKEMVTLMTQLQNDTIELRYNLGPEQQDYLIQYLLTTVNQIPGNTVEDRASLIEAQASVLMTSNQPREAQSLLIKLLHELQHSSPGSPKISSCLKLLTTAYKMNGQLADATKWRKMASLFDREHTSKVSMPSLDQSLNRSRPELTPFSQGNRQDADPEFPDYVTSQCSMGNHYQTLNYSRPLGLEALKAYKLNELKTARESGSVNALIAALLQLRARELNYDGFTAEEHIAFSQELEDIRAKQDSPFKLAWSKLSTADDYFIAGQYDRALEKWKEAAKLARTLPAQGSKSSDDLSLKITNLGYEFLTYGRLDDARTIFSEAFKFSLQAPTPFKRAIAIANIDRLCQKYGRTNDYNSSEAILKDALIAAQEHGSAGKVASRELQLRLANLYAQMKQPEKAGIAISDFILTDESTIDIGKRALIAGLTEHAKVLRENGYANSAAKLLALAQKEQSNAKRDKQDAHPSTSAKRYSPKAPVNENPRFALPSSNGS